jgi:hypothetical protein
MNILDTTGSILTLYESGQFNIEKWKAYMDSFVSGAKELCLADMQDCLESGFIWEKDYLLVLNAAIKTKMAGRNGVLIIWICSKILFPKT